LKVTEDSEKRFTFIFEFEEKANRVTSMYKAVMLFLSLKMEATYLAEKRLVDSTTFQKTELRIGMSVRASNHTNAGELVPDYTASHATRPVYSHRLEDVRSINIPHGSNSENFELGFSPFSSSRSHP
jgi:hypothetical protein